ncbi:amidohydrolase family protein [Moorella naiadis]|uniref:amidohydrolase family protein n=1 Tax=Moorella naiadis (nom. illeg.) TaxID=3093670 RepID=UPI003D9C840A
MIIIDTHAHLGLCRIFELDIKSEDLIRTMDENNIQISIVQPNPGAPDIHAAHIEVANLATKYPGRIFGMACFNPHVDEDEYLKDVNWAIKDLGFKGVKLHTNGFSISPISKDAEKVFKAAHKLQIPVMIHTGAGMPNASPALCIPPAKQYPDLNIILAHSGMGIYTAEAIVAAMECKNIFLETSWCLSIELKSLVNKIGAERVMFGSDGLENVPVELTKYRVAKLTEKQLEQCLGKTAMEIFKL